jgi:peptide-methionine (S)-S-oxide reductase
MHKKAMFGAGCFWSVEVAFRKVPGVTDTAVGYSGGTFAHPTYEDVCYTDTGHAEVVFVEYNPAVVTYDQLLETFWSIHDPTQLNRQGADVGEQYRSAIFVMDDEQEAAAQASKARQDASGRFMRPIATQIVRATAFWRAEDYHQRYLEKRGLAGCELVPQPLDADQVEAAIAEAAALDTEHAEDEQVESAPLKAGVAGKGKL